MPIIARKILLAWLTVSSLSSNSDMLGSTEAFSKTATSVRSLVQHRSTAFTTAMCMSSSNSNHQNEEIATELSTRRGWLNDIATKSVLAFGGTLLNTATALPYKAEASVFYDPDRYGDKELKIATVNKIRQNIRDTLLQDPTLAPLFLKVAIQDALTYDASTDAGGPDGTVIDVILSSDAPQSVAPLKPAAEKLVDIAQKIQRTTEITMADVVTFAGAEAIESAGGPRVTVQLGKLDPKKSKNSVVSSASSQYPDLCGKSSGKEVVDAFRQAGLTEREVALLYGAIGGMENVVESMNPQEEEEEENEMGDKEIFIPSSFGGPSQIYGKQLGSIDNSVFESVVNDMKKGRKPIADVFTDEKVQGWAQKYASKKGKFLNDLPEAYNKLMALGTQYTGGKMASLLGEKNE